INGQLVSSAGDPGTSRETTRPRLDPQTNVYHRNGAEELEIVLHVANFIDREGGRRRNIFLGTGEEANIRQYRTIAFEGILTGSLLLIGLYHLILYSFRRKEPLPLIFALVCFVFALRGVFQGERLILMLIEMPFSVYGKIWFIFYYILPPVVVLFLHYLFPQDVWPRMLHFILGIMTVFCVLTVFLSLSAGIRIMPYYHPVTLVSMLYAVWVLLRALRHSRPGSWPFTIGVFVLISTGIHDLLYTEGIIQTTYLAPAGLLAFVFSQSYFIAVLFSKSLARVKALSEQLRAYSIQLEDKVALRTRELENRNAAILESIEYARLIQSSVLPEDQELDRLFPERFLLWKPRDIVGGDFYWTHPTGENQGWIAVGDCTGHGVPGALMAMMAISLLNRETHILNTRNPAEFLHELNTAVRSALHREAQEKSANEGFDLLLAYYEPGRLYAAGAHLGIYCIHADGPRYYPGSRKGVGYVEPGSPFRFKSFEIDLEPGDSVYLMSDGLLDQNGGSKGFAFGRRRFMSLLGELQDKPFSSHAREIEDRLPRWADGRPQRDDIVLLGFSCTPQRYTMP
ncbi:MAG: SpoIIE family protein phosphatase, partial [Spirochaeta sp.]